MSIATLSDAAPRARAFGFVPVAACLLALALSASATLAGYSPDVGQGQRLAKQAIDGAAVVAARAPRLGKNGTRARSNEDDSKAGSAPTDPVKTISEQPAPQATTPRPETATPAPAPAKAEAATAAASPQPAVPSQQIECVANCNTPDRARVTTAPTAKAKADIAATSGGTECVAGCAGLQTTSTTVRQSPVANTTTPGDAAAGNGKITILRGVSRSRSYSTN